MRRITDRQIAELQKEKNEPGAKVYTIYVTEKPDKNDSVQETVFKNLEILTGSSKDQVGASKEQTDSFIYVVGDNKPAEVPSPDNRHNFAFYVQPYWMEEKFLISIYEKMGDNFKMIDKISSTWADLPLTDNMRFSDVNRFSVVPYKIVLKNKESSPLNYAILKFIWFPRGYYTLRERPLDQETYLELVGKKIDGGKKWAIF